MEGSSGSAATSSTVRGHQQSWTSGGHQQSWTSGGHLSSGWSRNVLVLQIETQLHRQQGKAINNFDEQLPTSLGQARWAEP